ncbi:aspartyl-phosphate phosphatase Spo0E family protein [Bacillus niameyensis]|uniref:aspartyl-phosphate phosphatase Spo0E family protein n=1 Tax=Bacillus niameyensis TaxID=1522308 RepID=UPI0007824255|nr:aspartyl-phosphate phosphatase Spo0E family protein [Bacillus niameyensis]
MCFSVNDQNNFLAKIQEKRKEMYLFGEMYGLNAEKTIICSQELDSLLNEYYQTFQATKSSKSIIIPRKNVANSFVRQQRLLQFAK